MKIVTISILAIFKKVNSTYSYSHRCKNQDSLILVIVKVYLRHFNDSQRDAFLIHYIWFFNAILPSYLWKWKRNEWIRTSYEYRNAKKKSIKLYMLYQKLFIPTNCSVSFTKQWLFSQQNPNTIRKSIRLIYRLMSATWVKWVFSLTCQMGRL